MQRIKSQSTSHIPSHTSSTNSRPRSKRNMKSHAVQNNYTQKIRNNNASITQNSLASVKTNSKMINSSMKNLKVAHQAQTIIKTSAQNTSRAINNNSAISARILKQIIGYSQRGGSKTKAFNKSRDLVQGQKQRTLQIDLTNQYQQQALAKTTQNYEQKQDQPRTTLSQNRSKSKSKSNSSNSKTKNQGKKSRNYIKNNHRVVQQFSPMNLSPKRANKVNKDLKQQQKKYSFFQNLNQEQDSPEKQQKTMKNNQQSNIIAQIKLNSPQNVRINRIQALNLQNSHSVCKNQIPSLNFQTWKDYSAINQLDSEDKQIKNIFLHNFNQIKKVQNIINSPNLSHILQSSLAYQKSPSCYQNISHLSIQDKVDKFNKQNYNNNKVVNIQQKLNIKSIQFSISQSRVDRMDRKNNTQFQKWIQQKQKLIICLQQSTTILDEHFQFNYKELIPTWKKIIQGEKRTKDLNQKLTQFESTLISKQKKDLQKKTELFQLNRDQICRKKQKQYATRTGKQKYMQQAVACQEGLRLKLSSKADYQHIILFNQKVVLTGQSNFQDLCQVFTQMFQNKLSKKFALIAKKQLSNLSVYDSRLIQDYLKKIQELQSSYLKSEYCTLQNGQTSHNYSTANQNSKIEHLVQEIQQITLDIQFTMNNIRSIKFQLKQIADNSQKLDMKIQQYIKSVNKKVSGQYKMVEGESFDFQLLLQDKYMKQFDLFKKQMINRDEIVQRLNVIQEQLRKNSKKNQIAGQNIQNNFDKQRSNYATLRQNKAVYKESSRRNSASFAESIPNQNAHLMNSISNRNLSNYNIGVSRIDGQSKINYDNMFKKQTNSHCF